MGTSTGDVAPALSRPARPRTLSKSDFKLARGCAAKLFFRENGYPDNRDSNNYLMMLAEGGYMVEALVKARYADGLQLDYGRDVAAEHARTVAHLRADDVTLFEATLLVGRRQARVDILEKRGSVVRLLEVKAKSFDSAEHAQRLADGKAGAFRGVKKPFGILAEWREKLEDITFQLLLLEKVLPGVVIKPYLVLVDKCTVAGIDDVPGCFELVHRGGPNGSRLLESARYTGTPEQLAHLHLVTEVDVSAEVAMLRDEVECAAAIFESRLDAPFSTHSAGVQRSAQCKSCEFKHAGTSGTAGAKDGFVDCWGALAEPRPHLLELFKVGSAKGPDKSDLVTWMIGAGTAALVDIPDAGLVKADGSIGPDAAWQRRQVDCTRRGATFIGPELRGNIDALAGGQAMYFIDFETSRLALPYHAGMRPYGQVAFQWSSHAVASFGDAPVHLEWLNSTDIWPNQTFAESLRAAIGDSGPVLTWTTFEVSVLKDITRDLAKFGREAPELVSWMADLAERRLVDLHKWAKYQYYHPAMGGRTSIKVVLDALWKSDEEMRRQFESWTGLPADGSRDPYTSLPPVEISGVMRDVHEGTGAMQAYQEMMYGAHKHDPLVKAHWAGLLKQYCKLDTLSMVLIFEHWRRATA